LINAENDSRSATPSAADAQAEPRRPVRVIVSELLAGGREAILVHDGQDYRLRITANGKLILTK
jgi:hemin uptake protein HemP